MATAVLFVGSVTVGALGGAFYGFCLAAHRAGMRGEVTTKNRLLRFMTAKADNLSLGQAVLYLAAIALSLVVFFGAMFTPALLMSWLAMPTGVEVQVAYVALLGAAFVGWHVGKRLWAQVA